MPTDPQTTKEETRLDTLGRPVGRRAVNRFPKQRPRDFPLEEQDEELESLEKLS